MRTAAVALACALGLLAVTGLWDRLIEGLIFQPTRGVDLSPAELGIDAEDVFLDTEDGVRIHAFWLPAAGARRALLFLHGNAGNASHRLPNAAQLARLGTHVLLLDYRGYGRSAGRATEAGVYADARAGLAHLTGARGLPEGRIVLFGRSLGGAVAVELARGRGLAGVILESTFTSVADVAASALGRAAALLAGSRFDAAARIGELRCPVLLLHGDRDEVVDPALGRRLFELAPAPKEFEPIRGAGHNDTTLVGGEPYFRRIGAFLDRVAPS